MKVRLAGFSALSIAVVLLVSSISMPDLMAQGKAEKAQKGEKAQKADKAQEKANIQGTVQNISKDTSTITVRTTGTVTRLVVYNPSTKFLYGHSDANKPGSVAQLKDSNYISCAGTFDAKNQLMATECVYRETK
jgi:hypothetical protein